MAAYLIEKQANGVLLFTINRPEKRNAINFEVMDGLKEAIQIAKENQDVKALMVTGSGTAAFCSGGDLSVFHGLKTEEQAYGMLSKMSHILYELVTLEKPTVALLNGAAVGGGCELAICCDYRLAKDGIRAGFIQGTLAITSGWGGGTILTEKFNSNKAQTMLMEARPYDTDELLELGFIDEIFTGDAVNAGNQFLKQFLDKQIGVLTAYKRMSIRKWEISRLQDRIEEEVVRCSVLWADEAHHEAVNNFMKQK